MKMGDRKSGLFERKSLGEVTRLEQKRLSAPFQVKSTDSEGTIEGNGAVFNLLHPTSSWALDYDWQDRIVEGAFKKTLAEHKKLGTLPLMLYMHERGNIHGAWRTVEESKESLKVVGQVAKSAISPSGVPTYELLKMGAINGLSIGFRVVTSQLNEEEKVRDILEVELAEISIVDIPGGPTARVTDVKSNDPKNPRFLETVLCDAGLSRKEAKALLAEGLNALRDAAANDGPTQRDADKAAGNTKSSVNSILEFAKFLRSTTQE